MADTEAPVVSILLLGDAETGKSTFLSRISRGSKSHNDKSPLAILRDGDQPFVFDITFFNHPYRFEFYDTASPETWSLLQPDVIVLCFDISSRLSLINAQRLWAKDIIRIFTSQREIPILFLGLKRDLRSETDENGIIYPQEGHRVAQELRCDRYMECSAVTGELVFEVFEDICRTGAMCKKKTGGGMSEGGCGVM